MPKTSTKAVVLLSGGLDSAVCLAMALEENDSVIAVNASYGQKHIKERQSAIAICNYYFDKGRDISLKILNLPDIFKGAGSTLTDPGLEQPHLTYSELAESQGPSPTVVPFRNANLLSVATTIAVVNKAQLVYAGMHAEDARNWAYPDCTPEFLGSFASAMYIGTYHQVRLMFPLIWMMKCDVVAEGEIRDVPFYLTWSCYAGGEDHCGKCPTCIERLKAFELNGMEDPVAYALQ